MSTTTASPARQSLLRPLLVVFGTLSVVTGLIYPFVTTGVSQLIFPSQANGSLMEVGGKVVGSELIGQPFSSPRYFWSRPSATSPMPYNAAASSGSNLGPTNPALADAVKARIQALHDADPDNHAPVPVDLVTASGSGLDPHISPDAATYQAPRIARLRNIPLTDVERLIDENTDTPTIGLLGAPGVNVLKLNLALDGHVESH